MWVFDFEFWVFVLKGKKWCFESVKKMGLISGIFMGMLFGIALMAGWARMMRYRSAKRIAKVWINDFVLFCFIDWC